MSSFEPSKEHLREVILFGFNWKKSAAKTHRILTEAYGEHAPAERTCQRWFRQFKEGDFDIKDKERSGQPKKFEDHELEAILNEDPNRTLNDLAQILNVTQTAVSKRLQSMGMTQIEGKWVPHN